MAGIAVTVLISVMEYHPRLETKKDKKYRERES
jgi:hypothetical protein